MFNRHARRADLLQARSHATSDGVPEADHGRHVTTGAEHVRDEEDGSGNAGDARDGSGSKAKARKESRDKDGRGTARLDGAETQARIGTPATSAFCTISNPPRPLTSRRRPRSARTGH
jgi:hypothetical protein